MPISLIGLQYKINAKLLANRFAKVVGEIVHPVQSASIEGSQILDGALMVNEVVTWAIAKQKNDDF